MFIKVNLSKKFFYLFSLWILMLGVFFPVNNYAQGVAITQKHVTKPLASAQANDNDPLVLNKGFRSFVTAIDGNIIECEGGLFADLSNAKIISRFGNRTIADVHKGGPVIINGDLVNDNGRSLIKASSAYIYSTNNEIILSAVLQEVDPANRMVKVFSQPVFIDDNAEMISKNGKKTKVKMSKLVVGKEASFYMEKTDRGLVAKLIFNLRNTDTSGEAGTDILSTITQIGENSFQLGNSFTIDGSNIIPFISKDPDFGPLFKVGRELGIGFTAAEKMNPHNPIKAGAVSGETTGIVLSNTLEDVDSQAKAVKVLGKTVLTTPQTTYFVQPKNGSGRDGSFADLKPGANVNVIVTVTENGIFAKYIGISD